MSRDPAALAADEEPAARAEAARAGVRPLRGGGPFAESLHILLVCVVAALVWNSLPLAVTAGWVGAVTAAALLRTWWRLRVRRRTVSTEEALRAVRLTETGLGLAWGIRSEEHTSELQSRLHLVCRLLLEKKKKKRAVRAR